MKDIDPKVAVEVLKIVEYLDDDLKKIINNDLVNYLESIKDGTYVFEIDKDVPLYENDFLDGTIEVLKELF